MDKREWYEVATNPVGGLGKPLEGIFVSLTDEAGDGEWHGPFSTVEDAEQFAGRSGAEKL